MQGTTLEDASIGVPVTLTPEVDTSKTEATKEGTPAPLSSTATSELMPVLEASTEPHMASSVPKVRGGVWSCSSLAPLALVLTGAPAQQGGWVALPQGCK